MLRVFSLAYDFIGPNKSIACTPSSSKGGKVSCKEGIQAPGILRYPSRNKNKQKNVNMSLLPSKPEEKKLLSNEHVHVTPAVQVAQEENYLL
ncbi:hypothetical protein SLE2022_258530 [Rubroshorea leprosula]